MSKAVTMFMLEEVTCRHSLFGWLVFEGPKNKKYVEALALLYVITRVYISP